MIRTGDGSAGRVDLLFRELCVILEYEGDQHRVDRAQWNLDISRVEAFDRAGFNPEWTALFESIAR